MTEAEFWDCYAACHAADPFAEQPATGFVRDSRGRCPVAAVAEARGLKATRSANGGGRPRGGGTLARTKPATVAVEAGQLAVKLGLPGRFAEDIALAADLRATPAAAAYYADLMELRRRLLRGGV
jgi:hypothetical protein